MSPQEASQIDPGLLESPREYFDLMGAKLNVHFTRHQYHSSSVNIPATTDESFDPSVSTIDALVEEIEKKMPGVRVILDERNKKNPVIHVIDKAAEEKSKVLDRVIDLDYSGPVGYVSRELKEKGIPQIAWPLSGGNTEAFNDMLTDVTINVKQRSIRDILTHCVDINRYYWIIWEAKTIEEPDGWETQIRFTRSMESDVKTD